MTISKSLLALAVATAAGGASAAATVWDYTGNSGALAVTVSLDGGATTQSVRTTELFGSNTVPLGSFAAFCLEPTTPVGDFIGMSYLVATVSAPQAAAFSKVFTGAGWESWASGTDLVTMGAQRAAIQVAVWDIIIDGTYDLTAGAFRATSALSDVFYAAGDTSLKNNIYRLTDNIQERMGKQDVIIVTAPPIPEPSTYALMIAGIAAVGFVARRRSNRA